MINHSTRMQLLDNWGDEMYALEKLAPVKFHEPHSGFECYVIALDHEDNDTIYVLVHNKEISISLWSLRDLYLWMNRNGDKLEVDDEYRPRKAKEIFSRLGGR